MIVQFIYYNYSRHVFFNLTTYLMVFLFVNIIKVNCCGQYVNGKKQIILIKINKDNKNERREKYQDGH